jgi:energy-coupling factor transporter ATP-binding protein EcfA2
MSLVLHSLKTTSGHLAAAGITFSEKLTCIIGARGTCKSTLVETLRFLFDADPERVALMVERNAKAHESGPHAGLISATLGHGTATCAAMQPDGTSLLIERDVGRRSQVLRDGVEQADSIGVLAQVEIYSQGDLQRIAEDPRRSLALVDRRLRARRTEIEERREAALARLQAIGPRIRVLRNEVVAKRTLLAPLEGHRESLKEVERNRPIHSIELAQERERHMARRSAVEIVKSGLDSRTVLARNTESLDRNVTKLIAASKALDSIGGADSQFLAIDFKEVSHALAVLRQKLQGHSPEEMNQVFERVARTAEGQSTRYHTLRREQEAVNESLRKEETLRAEIEKLERVESDITDAQDELDGMLAERIALRQRLCELADELFSLRDADIGGIETAFGSRIFVTLHRAMDSEEIVCLLKEHILPGSNVRNQDEVAREVAERISCSDLIDIVEGGDAQRLGSLLQRDAARLVAHFADHPRLYELDGLLKQDALEIEMVVHGVRKPIGQLSKGQKATALLPLILRAAEYPLVFDQPEDDLDNAYISESLIEGILHVKAKRQLIFVTHNANIPVLGDAERIVVMEMDGPNSAVTTSGTVTEMRESIISLLEGGREAFRRRGARYGDMSTIKSSIT